MDFFDEALEQVCEKRRFRLLAFLFATCARRTFPVPDKARSRSEEQLN